MSRSNRRAGSCTTARARRLGVVAAREHGSAHIHVLLLVMLAVCVGAVVKMFVAPRSASVTAGEPNDVDGDATLIPDAEATVSLAHVQGQVFLEAPPATPATPDIAAPTQPETDDGTQVEPEGADADAEPEDADADAEPEDADAVAEPEDADAVAEPEEADAVAEPEPARAEVELAPPKAESCRIRAWQNGTPVSDVVTCDAEGRFDVPVRASGRTSFEIEISGRLRAVLEAEVPEGGRGRLPGVALGIAEAVRGQVMDRRGKPVAGVTVEAMPNPNLGEPEPWRATTDADGNFLFDTLPPGPVSLRCAAPGFTPTIVEAIAPQDDVLLVLDGLHDLKGRVIAGPLETSRIAVRI